MTWRGIIAVSAFALLAGGCQGGDNVANGSRATSTTIDDGANSSASALISVTVSSTNGDHVFRVERAVTKAEQARGLMYRTGLKPDGGMLFAPYPAEGGGPREASFWMANTPTPLDIIFIRADGTIARIAENTVPFSEASVSSGEPVSAVLEIVGGRSADLGIGEGDKVRWSGH